MTQPRTVLNTLLHEKKRKISGGFYHRLQVDFAYNSNHIEGSRLTHEQTRYIFETHTVDGTAHVNDILEAANHFKCIDYVLDNVNEPITEELWENRNKNCLCYVTDRMAFAKKRMEEPLLYRCNSHRI